MLTTINLNPAVLTLTASDSPSPNQQQEGYIPGVCNIGKKEIERRKRAAIFSFALCIFCIVLIQWLGADRVWKLLLFIPAASLGVSFQQWYFKFCVAFGMKGVFNFGDIGKTFSIEQKEYFRKDRMKAWTMIISGLLFGVIVALVYYYSPI